MGFVTIPPSPFPPSSGKTGDIVERVAELENDVSTLQSTKAPKTDIAPAFSVETNYSVGDLVYYNGALYECITEHTAGAWDLEDFNETAIDEQLNAINNDVGTLVNTKAPKTDIAPAFSVETNYSVGDLVYYNGALYECTTEHTAGAWNSEHFTATAIDDQLNEINSNLTSATAIQTLSFADSQKCTLYTGTDGWRGANRIQVYGGHLVHVDFDITLTENVSDSWVLQLPEGVYPTCAIRSDVAYINKNNGRIYANGNANDVIIGSFDYII